MIEIRPFQRRFLRAALAPTTTTAALSLPRGNGKSWLAARIAADAMADLAAGEEIALAAASIEQGRIVFRFIRQMLGEAGWRYLDSSTRCAVTSRANGARLRVLGSNGRTSMGLVNTPLVVADEPGAWEVNGGGLMHDAIQTAQGKPGSPLRAVYIGTLAPATGGWWHQLTESGSRRSTHVTLLQGDPERWDKWPEIRRCNPLANISPEFRLKLLEERDEARADSRLKARFLSYRLNVPTADESTVLLTVEDWRRVEAREIPPREGRPVVGLDLGGGRAWSAAVAWWRTGRVEAFAIAPGLPGLDTQERRDRVPAGAYRKLVELGALHVAEGLRVPSAVELVERVRLWKPAAIVCDRFELNRLRDAAPDLRLEPRITRWSEATADIAALRKYAADGPLAVAPESAALVAASLAIAKVKSDDQGSTRIVKRDPANNTSRDDVAIALTLAAGGVSRGLANVPEPGWRIVGLVG